MPSSLVDRDRAAGGGFAQALATLGGALLLILAFVAALALVIDVSGRFGGGAGLLGPEFVEFASTYFSLGFAALSLLALPAALAAPFVRDLRSHSALALVPGCLMALLVWLAALAVVVALIPGGIDTRLEMGLRRTLAAFDSYVFLVVPLAIAVATAIGGARTPESTAAAAAPVVLAALSGFIGDLSITRVFLAMALPLLAALIAMALLYTAAPARAVTPWLAGIALALGLALPLATGAMTPAEGVALVALFALPIGLLVRTLALRQPFGAMLRQMAMETVAVVAVLAAVVLFMTAFTLAGIRFEDAVGPDTGPVILIVGGGAFFVASYLLTAALALGLLAPLVFVATKAVGIEPTLGAAVVVLLGLATTLARAARRDPPGVGLPPPAAWIGAALFVILAALAALFPAVALAPMRALLQ